MRTHVSNLTNLPYGGDCNWLYGYLLHFAIASKYACMFSHGMLTSYKEFSVVRNKQQQATDITDRFQEIL